MNLDCVLKFRVTSCGVDVANYVYTILNQHTSFMIVVPVSNSALKDGLFLQGA